MKKSMQDRLTTPMIREKGELRAASWDEALERAAGDLGRIREKYGQPGFGMFSCSKTTNELNFLAQKFARSVMGTNNIDSCNRT
jgi:formate dehydrogenase major subunit